MDVVGGRRARAGPRSLLHVRGEDLPALVGARFCALLLGKALALAAILGLAGIVGAGAAPLPLALVDAGALHDLRAFLCLLGLVCGARGAGGEQRTDGARDDGPLHHFTDHLFLPFVAAVNGPRERPETWWIP